MAVTTTEEFRIKLSADDKATGSIKGAADAAKAAVKGFESLEGKLVAMQSAMALAGRAFAAFKSIASAAFAEPVKMAIAAETANNRLVMSLKSVVLASTANVDAISKFADAMRDAAGVDDDLVKKVIATNLAIGMTIPQAEEAAKAAAVLAYKTGTDLVSANQALIGTLNGVDRELKKVDPAIASLSKEAERHGAAIKVMAKGYDEFATGDAKTTEGALTRLGLAWEDVQKKVGTFLIQGADLGNKMGTVREAFDKLSSIIDDNKEALQAIGRVVTTEVINAITQMASALKELGPILPDLTKGFSDLMRLALIPFIQVALQAASVWAGLTGRMHTVDKLDAMVDKLSESWNAAGKSFLGFTSDLEKGQGALSSTLKKFTEIDAIGKKLATITFGKLGSVASNTPGAEAPAAKAAPDTGAYKMKMSDELARQQLMAQRGLNDQRLALELSYGNELVAANVQALNKIKEAEQDAQHDGINISKQSAELKEAIANKLAVDQRKEHLADAATAAQAAGNVAAIAQTQYAADVASYREALDKKHMGLNEYTAAVLESERKVYLAQLDNSARIATITEDATMAAETQLAQQLSDYQKMLADKAISREQFEKASQIATERAGNAVATAPINAATKAVSIENVSPMAAAADKFLDAVQALIDFVPQFLEKIANIFNSLTALPMKIAGAIADVFKSVLNFVNNFAKNIGQMVTKVLTSIADFAAKLPDAIDRLIQQIPVIIGQLVDRVPRIIEQITRSLITAAPKIAVTLVTTLVKSGPFIAWSIIRVMAIELPAAILRGVRDALKDMVGMLKKGVKVPPLEVNPKPLISALKGSSSDIFKVEDFKAAAKSVDLGERVATSAKQAAVTMGNFFANIWKYLVQALKDAWQWIKDKIIGPIIDLLTHVWDFLKEKIFDPIIKALGAVFDFLMTNVFEPIIKALGAVWNTLKTVVFDPIISAIRTVWNDVMILLNGEWELLKAAWRIVTTLLETEWALMQTAWKVVVGWLDACWTGAKAVFNEIIVLFKGAWEIFRIVGKGITDIFTGNIGDLKTVGTNLTTALTGIVTSFKTTFDTITAAFKKVVDPLTAFKWPTFSWPALPSLSGLSWPKLPLLSSMSWPSLPSLSSLRWPSWPSLPSLPKLQIDTGGLPTIKIEKPSWWPSSIGGIVPKGGVVGQAGGVISQAGSEGSAAVNNVGSVVTGKKKIFAAGGIVTPMLYAASGTLVEGTDTVPSMLTAGEFVVNRHAVGRVGVPTLERINNGQAPGGGGLTVNVELTVNTTQPVDGAFIRGKLVPVLMDAIKSASESGKYVVNSKGVRSA